MAIYFSDPVPQPFQKSAQFISAIPYNPESGRYLSIDVDVNSEEKTLDDQLMTINGNYAMDEDASMVTIVAVALNNQGNIIGLRRWQSSLTKPGRKGEFQIELAAVSGEITEYILFAEAQP